VAIAFILLSAGSLIYVSFATWNYLQYYPALARLESNIKVDGVSLAPGPGVGQSTISVQISVRNPSDYSGFRIGQVSLSVFFYPQTNRSLTLFYSPSRLNASQLVGRQLAANSIDSVTVSISLTSEQTKELNSFTRMYPQPVMAEVMLRIDVITFLESVTGTNPYTGTTDIPLS
jgi:hypothetical protein